jgi:hypothetical protein
MKDSTVLLWLLVAARILLSDPDPEPDPDGKFVRACTPLKARAAESYARAAASAESKVPSQRGVFRVGSRISAAYLPDGRLRTPLYRISDTGGVGVGAGAGTECLDLRISLELVRMSLEKGEKEGREGGKGFESGD